MTRFLTLPSRNTLSMLALAGLFCVSVMGEKAVAGQNECRLMLSEPQMDYGRLLRSQMIKANAAQGSVYEMGKRSLVLTATCPTSVPIGLSFNGQGLDERNYRFALNGSLNFRVLNAQLDGRSVQLLPLDQGRSASGPSLIYPGKLMAPYDGGQVARGENLTVWIEVETLIDEASTRVSNATQWKSGGEFEIRPL